MDTIVIKLNESGKGQLLMEMLKSLDFVISVNYFDKQIAAKKLFEEINKIAAKSSLSEMSLEDINQEIKAYRYEKQTRSN